MKRFYSLAALIILSFCIHAFLSKEFYDVHYGFGSSSSFCKINETFNCEAVAASSYSSVFGIPLSVFGLIVHLVLLLFLLLFKFDEKNQNKWNLGLVTLSAGSFIASVVMGLISVTQLSVYCPNCLALYVLSLLILIVSLLGTKEIFKINFVPNLIKLGIFLVAIPLLSFVVHKSFERRYAGSQNLSKILPEHVKAWKAAKTNDFKSPPSFKINEGAAIKITEFADFLCGHCKKASRVLKAFVSGNKNVEFSFYVYPLDPACNPSMREKGYQPGPGASCLLSKGVHCAGKQGRGVKLHDYIFDHQDEFKKIALKSDLLKEKMSSQLEGLDLNSWNTCLDSTEAKDFVENQAKAGGNAKVQGTPAIYINGKKVRNSRSLMATLQAIVQEASN